MLKLMLARKQKGMTQEELAEKMLTSKQQISYWETGSRTMKINDLKKICEILEVTSDFILDMEGR